MMLTDLPEDATHDQAFELLDTAVAQANSMHYDGCHKIYLAMDQAQTDRSIELGYESVAPDIETITAWYYTSCFLVFINAIYTDENGGEHYVDIIPQAFNPENDDDEDDGDSDDE